jgi:hypothetical protein
MPGWRPEVETPLGWAARGLVQDALRVLIGQGLVLAGHLLEVPHRARLEGYRAAQARLRSRYRVAGEHPVRGWGPEVQAEVEAWAAARRGPVRFAETSGTTATPKRLAYPPRRLRRATWAFVDAFSRLYAARPELTRHSLYVFTALDTDGSLTGMMVPADDAPARISLLQAPYRAHGRPGLRRVAERYGAAAARVLVLALANPGVLYATNPSTLSAFFEALPGQWRLVQALLRALLEGGTQLDDEVRRLAARLASRGAWARLSALARADAPPPAAAWLPGLQLVVCWDGGYVAPFLERLRTHLPGVPHVPMYSMSTETLETTLHLPRPDDVAFLPAAPGVLYELLPEGAPDHPGHLIPPWAASPGARYTLVVSDGYGLTRYQTGDLFECRRMVEGLPDLRFLRRRDLEHSFTGEKLTAAQVQAALTAIRAARPGLDGAYLTLLPQTPAAPALPGYRLMVLAEPAPRLDLPTLAAAADAALAEVNREYAAKRASGRLAPLEADVMAPGAFALAMGGGPGWESQFKFVPLYRRPLLERGR